VARKQARPEPEEAFMAFQVAELSIELIEVLAPLMPRIKQRDKSLADHRRGDRSRLKASA
jgi:hypothetical protein